MRWDSPTVQRRIAAHQARGEDPWLLLAGALARLADLEVRTDGVTEFQCCWLSQRIDPTTGEYIGVQCSAMDTRDDKRPSSNTLWWDITRSGGNRPHIPLCPDHIDEIERRTERAIYHGLKTVDSCEWHHVADAGPVVYYVRRIDGMIKIGYSKNLRARLNQLRTGTGPVEVVAVEPGDMQLERDRHRQFARDRRAGEWFFPSPSLMAHIAFVAPIAPLAE